VSILVEIAEKADVPVEGVIRVLTREPVSDAVMERVLGVLDDLTPEQTRAVQRFALAALHDVLPRPLAGDVPRYPEAEAAEEALAALPAAPDDAVEQLPAAPAPSDAALVQLSSVLSELAEAVRDLRRETDEERRERVDDLAVLIDLITTGWQGLDARLGRIEKQVGRLDAGRRPVAAPLPIPAVSPAPAAAETPPPVAAAEPESRRSRIPLAAALTLAGAVIGTFVVLQLSSTGPDVADLVSASGEQAETGQGSSSTTGGVPTHGGVTTPVRTTAPARPPATQPPARTTTSSVLGTSVGKTQPTPKRKPPVSKPPAATTTTPGTASFKPTRNWAWAPVPKADYYSVEFTKGGTSFYRATPAEPRLSLPDSVVFTPGAYRWIVRAGFGARAAKRLGDPVVNSGFTVS
jgi:hypothetical protein